MRREVFISYSHKDAKFLSELRQHLVPFEREYKVTIWDDNKIQPGSLWRSEISEALKKAKVAVLLVTANFMASSFISETELPAILLEAQKEGLIVLWVAVSASAYQITEIAKFQAMNDPAKPLDTMRGYQRRAAWVEIAETIYNCSGIDCAQIDCSAIQQPQANPIDHRKRVLLAQATDDAEEEADQLRSYLRQFDDQIVVLPNADYPQGGEAFKKAFEDDVKQANLFVQLLGRRAGRVPPDLPDGYTRYQFERARTSGVPIMQWRHPQLDLASVGDPKYLQMLTAETVVASGLEAFKRQILGWARKPPPAAARPAQASTVFINADERDLHIAKDVERECLRNALTTVLPMTGPSAEAIRRDLTENLIDCDVLVFIYGDTTLEWIRSQLKFYSKIRPKRESNPKLLAICSGPPPKPDIGVSLPDAHLIKCPEGWNLDPIRKLIAELR